MIEIIWKSKNFNLLNINQFQIWRQSDFCDPEEINQKCHQLFQY